AELGRDREQLEVERESLDEKEWQNIIRNAAAEHLQAHLRVPDVEPEEDSVELLVAPARYASRAQISDDRSRVALRPDREVQPFRSRHVVVRRDGHWYDAVFGDV